MIWLPAAVARGIARTLSALAARSKGRVSCERWARLAFPLDGSLESAPQVVLDAVTEADIEQWEHHADGKAAQLRSAHRFWHHGLRHAFVYREGSNPRCTVWMLTARDNPRLRRLPDWAGMYPPLAPTHGRLENLFVFSDARRSGVGSRFVRAVFAEAVARGMTRLLTHIAERNEAACAHATQVGWRRYGTITRFVIDLPLLRAVPLYVHVLHRSAPSIDPPGYRLSEGSRSSAPPMTTAATPAHTGMFTVRRSLT
jgi:GNAT superfamily N-acetyltransferase